FQYRLARGTEADDLQLHRTAWLSHETGILEPRSRSQPSLQRFPAAETNVIGEAAQQSPAVAEACYPFYRKHRRHRPVTGREFITLPGGTAAGPLAARGQQGERMRRVGVLMALAADDPEGLARVTAFAQRRYPLARRSSMLLATSSQTAANSRSSCLMKASSVFSASRRCMAACCRR